MINTRSAEPQLIKSHPKNRLYFKDESWELIDLIRSQHSVKLGIEFLVY